MPTDTERRETARRLRELDDSELQVYDMTYFAIQHAVGGDSEPYLDGRELTDRLADLIEPSGHECVPGECPLNVRHDNDRIDRDELVDEVKELEKCAWYFGLDFDEDEPLLDRLKEASEDFAGSADRIRKALGVES